MVECTNGAAGTAFAYYEPEYDEFSELTVKGTLAYSSSRLTTMRSKRSSEVLRGHVVTIADGA